MLYLLGKAKKQKGTQTVSVQVHLNTKNEQAPICFVEGERFGSGGGCYKPQLVLTNDYFKEILYLCELDWVLSFCEEAESSGALLDTTGILESYLYRNGKSASAISS